MMRMVKKLTNKIKTSSCSLKGDNKGFSLLELLIAITILAIVVSPFLHTFLTTAKVNSKAKRMLRATSVAENMMESLSGKTIDEINAKMNSVSSSDLDSDEKKYCYVLDDVEQDGIKYDVEISIDTSNYYRPDPSLAEMANDKALIKIDSIDFDKDVFYNYDKMADNAAYSFFVQKSIENSTNRDADYFAQRVTRKFKYVISAASGIPEVSLEVSYTLPNTDTSVAAAYRVFSKTYSLRNAASGNSELRNIYLLYLPNYKSFTPYSDVFEIDNSSDHVVTNIYIVKQAYGNDSELTSNESSYKARVDLIEGADNDVSSDAVTGIYTNFNINMGLLNLNSSSFAYKMSDPTRYTYNKVNDASARDKLKVRDLAGTETGDRMYDMTVSVYQGDAYDGGTSVLDSSKFIMKLDK